MKVAHDEDGGTHLKLWGQVQTSDVLCHPQSQVLANHFFLPHLDGMEALIALAAGKGLELPGSCRQGTDMLKKQAQISKCHFIRFINQHDN